MKNNRGFRIALCACLTTCCFAAYGAQGMRPATAPAIPGHGEIYVPENRDAGFAVSPHAATKIAFAATAAPATRKTVDPTLERVARSINLYVADGVPLDHLQCVLVLGRDAAATALNDARYRERFGIPNPNLELLARLQAAGVRVVVSGQAFSAQGLNTGDAAPGAKLALSSLTALSALVQDGYSIMPL